MKSVLIVIFIETTNIDKKVEIELSVLFWLLTEFEAHFDSNVIINYLKYVIISQEGSGSPPEQQIGCRALGLAKWKSWPGSKSALYLLFLTLHSAG